MASKRHESIVINQGQTYYNLDCINIATIIQEELEVSTDEVSEKQATGLVNITGMSYEMGMLSGLKMGEQIGHKLNRLVTMN